MKEFKRIVVVGAYSAIAEQVARIFAAEGAEFVLVGRREEPLRAVSQDLQTRGAGKAQIFELDALEFSRFTFLREEAVRSLGEIDLLFIAHGSLPDQAQCEVSMDETKKQLDINFTSTALLLTEFANYFAERGSGTIAVISSVAGDRGRQSNYVYGASKAALNAFLQGLRNRLWKKGVSVVTIKPGFVKTPMTRHLKQGPLFAEPLYVARVIHAALKRGREEVYVPWFWWIIMSIICSIPEKIFKRLSL